MKWLTKKEQTAAETAAAQEKIPLTHRLWAKIVAFALVVMMIPAFLACCLGAVAMWEMGVYTTPEAKALDEALENTASTVAYDAANAVIDGNTALAAEQWINSNVAGLKVTTTGYKTISYNSGTEDLTTTHTYTYEFVHVREVDTGNSYLLHPGDLTPQGEASDALQVTHITVVIALRDTFVLGDELYLTSLAIHAIYTLRIWVYPSPSLLLLWPLHPLSF